LPESHLHPPPSPSSRPTQVNHPISLSCWLRSPLEHDAYTSVCRIGELARRRAEGQLAPAPEHRTILVAVFEDSRQSCSMVQQVRWVGHLVGSGRWLCLAMVATISKHPETSSTQPYENKMPTVHCYIGLGPCHGKPCHGKPCYGKPSDGKPCGNQYQPCNDLTLLA
jgi:hypothetical protein